MLTTQLIMAWFHSYFRGKRQWEARKFVHDNAWSLNSNEWLLSCNLIIMMILLGILCDHLTSILLGVYTTLLCLENYRMIDVDHWKLQDVDPWKCCFDHTKTLWQCCHLYVITNKITKRNTTFRSDYSKKNYYACCNALRKLRERGCPRTHNLTIITATALGYREWITFCKVWAMDLV